MRSKSVYIRDLRQKIDLVKGALGLAEDRDFAAAIGVRPQRIDDDLSDRGQGPGWIPAARLEAMTALLARERPGRFTLEQARLAWRSDLTSFEIALAPYPDNAFGQLLDRTLPTLTMRLHEQPVRGFDLGDAGPPPDPAIEFFPADRPFQIYVEAQPGRLLVVVTESHRGWHLAAPRDPEALVIGSEGHILAPPRGLLFPLDGGIHTFYAFAVEALGPPGILARAQRQEPLSTDERVAFAVDLQDPLRTRRFELGRLIVFAGRQNRMATTGDS